MDYLQNGGNQGSEIKPHQNFFKKLNESQEQGLITYSNFEKIRNSDEILLKGQSSLFEQSQNSLGQRQDTDENLGSAYDGTLPNKLATNLDFFR